MSDTGSMGERDGNEKRASADGSGSEGSSGQAPGPGLSSAEASERLARYGPNRLPEEKRNRLLSLLKRMWGPVPWMLEVTIVLEFVLTRYTEAVIIVVLLVFNAVLSFFQENRAHDAVELLRERLTVQARVFRDGRWQLMPADRLVPGDVAHVRAGDLVPADMRIEEGEISVDQSSLTGESLPVSVRPGGTAYAGSTCTRGEASGEIVATGARTYYGRTAELVRTAKVQSHLERVILTIVKYLVAMDLLLVIGVVIYAVLRGLGYAEILPFALILLIASVPIALLPTFTLASALGSRSLAHAGVLVTRLSAIQDAAAMDVVYCDKTGTITRNKLALVSLRAYSPHGESDVLRTAALASEEATQDPIDLAIIQAARDKGVMPSAVEKQKFIPFDPSTKRSEALLRLGDHDFRAVKGAPRVVGKLFDGTSIDSDLQEMASKGYRVLAVAGGPPDKPTMMGLVALQDPPWPDSRELIGSLHDLGLRVLMVTGDDLATADTVARDVGVGDRACTLDELDKLGKGLPECDVFAGIFPQDKFKLVQGAQQDGHVTGMTGDGVNDAPALRQAEVGIAVASATDVAKAAASLVLTKPGLGDIVHAVQEGRRIYQRMLTYTLNKIIKTFQISLFLSLGLFITATFVTTPLLILLLLFANDFVTMSITTDRVPFSSKPEQWEVKRIVAASLIMALPLLAFSFGTFYVGRDLLHLHVANLQTLVFVMLVVTGQGTVYLVRERRHFWGSMPSRWLIASTVGDLVVIILLATLGVLMAPISLALVAGTIGAVLIYMFAVDYLKIAVFRRLHL